MFGKWWRGIDPTGPAGLILVALAGIYGVSIANVLPSYVAAWVLHLRMPEGVAGEIATVNMLAHAAGLSATLYLVTRWSLPKIAYTGLLLGVAGDLASIMATSAGMLAACRVLSGVGLGLQFGAVINWFGRNSNSTRGFGFYILLQFILSAIFFVVLPSFESAIGLPAIYLGVMPFALVAAVCLVVLNLNGGSVPLARPAHSTSAPSASGAQSFPMLRKLLAVLAFAAFNIAALGSWAFMQKFGESTGLSSEAASRSLALCSLAGIAGALIVVAAGSRFGRLVPLVITLSLFASPFAVFALTSTPPAIFVTGQLFIGLTWTMIVPYFEDIQSALDRTGRLTVLGMVAATVAAAAGPGAFGFLVGHGDDYRRAFGFALLAFALSALCSIYPGKVADTQRT